MIGSNYSGVDSKLEVNGWHFEWCLKRGKPTTNPLDPRLDLLGLGDDSYPYLPKLWMENDIKEPVSLVHSKKKYQCNAMSSTTPKGKDYQGFIVWRRNLGESVDLSLITDCYWAPNTPSQTSGLKSNFCTSWESLTVIENLSGTVQHNTLVALLLLGLRGCLCRCCGRDMARELQPHLRHLETMGS